jgi:hypothetical protein
MATSFFFFQGRAATTSGGCLPTRTRRLRRLTSHEHTSMAANTTNHPAATTPVIRPARRRHEARRKQRGASRANTEPPLQRHGAARAPPVVVASPSPTPSAVCCRCACVEASPATKARGFLSRGNCNRICNSGWMDGSTRMQKIAHLRGGCLGSLSVQFRRQRPAISSCPCSRARFQCSCTFSAARFLELPYIPVFFSSTVFFLFGSAAAAT